MVNFGGSPLVAANAAAVVLCQYLLAELVAQSWPGVGQVESEEGNHVGGDDQGSQRVGAADIAYCLPHVADLLGLLAAVFRAEADVLLSNLGRVERLKAAGAQPNPPLLLHGHRARLLPCNRTKHLCCEQPTQLCATAASAQRLCQYPTEEWRSWRVEGHGCVALHREEPAAMTVDKDPFQGSRIPLSELFQRYTTAEEAPTAPDLSHDPPACDANCPTAGAFSDDFW